MTSSVEHGTNSGYTYHIQRWKTPPCDACKAAKKKYYDRQSKAQAAATTRLKKLHPTLWKALYAEEKAKRGL